jgi:flap endonuclease-1
LKLSSKNIYWNLKKIFQFSINFNEQNYIEKVKVVRESIDRFFVLSITSMGIHDFYKCIKLRAPEQLKSYHLSEFCGNRWAVDISIFLFKFIKSAGNYDWMGSFFLFLCTLKKHGIKTVCIFDGPNPPIEKKIEQDRRRRDGQKAVDRLKRCIELRSEIMKVYSQTRDTLPEEMQQECKTLYGNPKKKIRLNPIDWSDWTEVVDALTSTIESLEKQTLPITSEHRETAKKIVQMMGLPMFQADGEAEGLCAFMAIHGHVDGVLTEDTDVLAYGTPWMFAFKDFKLTDEKVYGIHLPSLRKSMGYTQKELLDLCILLGCDYNRKDDDGKKIGITGFPPDEKKRKKSVNIGMIAALSFIDEYKTLENCLPYIDNPEPLIYERCREIFTPPSGRETLEIIKIMPYNARPNFEIVEQFILDNRVSTSIEYIKKIWNSATIILHDSSSEEESLKSASESIEV